MMLVDITGSTLKELMDFDTIITMNKKKSFPLLVKSDFSNSIDFFYD